jgi:hypothetical protein
LREEAPMRLSIEGVCIDDDMPLDTACDIELHICGSKDDKTLDWMIEENDYNCQLLVLTDILVGFGRD